MYKEKNVYGIINGVSRGVIETLFDEHNQPWFKRAHVGNFLDIKHIDTSLEGLNNDEIRPRSVFKFTPVLRGVNLDLKVGKKRRISSYVCHREKSKVKGKTASRVGIERRCPSRVQQDVKRKDTQLALLNDDLIESQELVRQLEYNNTGLQGEIRAKDKIVQDLIDNRHVPRERGGVDNMLCFIDKGVDEEEHRYYVIRWCRFKVDVIKKPFYYKNYFSLDTLEKRELFETAFDI